MKTMKKNDMNWIALKKKNREERYALIYIKTKAEFKVELVACDWVGSAMQKLTKKPQKNNA